MNTKIVAWLLLFVFASRGLAADEARKSQEDEIRDAVFRWQFEHNASGLGKEAGAYFLQIGKGDPSEEFTKRFANHKPPVRKFSACSANPGRGVIDKQTKAQGLIFRVTGIEWKSDTEVEVEGGYYANGLDGSGNTYTVTKENGRWKVTNDGLNVIS